MGSLGISELVVIFVIVLVFFGPRRFPEIARSMGSAMREFRRSLNQIQRELEEADPRKDVPGMDILKEFRSGKPGNWLDPDRTGTAGRSAPGVRSAPEVSQPQVTGEAGAAAPGSAPAAAPAQAPPADPSSAPAPHPSTDDDQLPMFESPDEAPTDDNRSG